MTSLDTLKQAAQALRDTKPELATALEAMAEMQPVGQVLTEAERLRCELRGGPFIWFGMPAPGALLYAAPIATPEHDAQVRNAALEEAVSDCRDLLAHFMVQAHIQRVLENQIERLRALKTTGGAA